MIKCFYEGQKLRGVVMSGGYKVSITDTDNPIESITIIMERGQMGMVPWAGVMFEDESVEKLNLALAAGVSLWEKVTPKDQDK